MSKRNLKSIGASWQPPAKRARFSQNSNHESSSLSGSMIESTGDDHYSFDSDVIETDDDKSSDDDSDSNNHNDNSLRSKSKTKSKTQIKTKSTRKITANNANKRKSKHKSKSKKRRSKSKSKSKHKRISYLPESSDNEATSVESNDINEIADKLNEETQHVIFLQSNNALQGRNKTYATIYKHRNSALGLQAEIDSILARHSAITNNAKREHCAFGYTTFTTTKTGKERVSKIVELIDNWQIPPKFDWNRFGLCFVITINK